MVSTPNIPLKILQESCPMVRYYTSPFTYCRYKVTIHPSLLRIFQVYECFSLAIINSAPVYSQQCPGLDNQLHGFPIHNSFNYSDLHRLDYAVLTYNTKLKWLSTTKVYHLIFQAAVFHGLAQHSRHQRIKLWILQLLQWEKRALKVSYASK